MGKISIVPRSAEFIIKKILSLLLAAVILAQNALAAPVDAQYLKTNNLLNDDKIISDLNKIDSSCQNGEADNTYRKELLLESGLAIKAINDSPERKRLLSLKKKGLSEYGDMAPMYIKAAGAGQIRILENKLKSFLGEFLGQSKPMPYARFEKDYIRLIKDIAEENASESEYRSPFPFKSAKDSLFNDLILAFPAKKAYEEYKKDAKAQTLWRESNAAELEEAAYKITRAAITAIGAENLSLELSELLLDLKLNGKSVITPEERKAIYNYNLSFLKKQDFKSFPANKSLNEKEKAALSLLIKNLEESIIILSYIATPQDKNYPYALLGLIHRSEGSFAFSHILGAGVSALLAKGHYATLDNLLDRYTRMEKKNADWDEWLNLNHYANMLQNASGKYLGYISAQAQYNTDYFYGNTFADIAALLAKDASPKALLLLDKYAYNRNMEDVIKPFLFGALSAKTDAGQLKRNQTLALRLANINFGDISPTYEYDLDRALLEKYPEIRPSLGPGAIVDNERKNNKKTKDAIFSYINKAATAGDIALAVWGR